MLSLDSETSLKFVAMMQDFAHSWYYTLIPKAAKPDMKPRTAAPEEPPAPWLIEAG